VRAAHLRGRMLVYASFQKECDVNSSLFAEIHRYTEAKRRKVSIGTIMESMWLYAH
jgi:hypothetical protein